MDKNELKRTLTPLQYHVTQEEGTEPPFNNKYWDNERPGIYVDIISKKPLFSSHDKYKSGTGWPSFTKPLEPSEIEYKIDRKLFSTRTEIKGKQSGAHIGHVFSDGPTPTGKRYCMNSAGLEFIPAKKLKERGFEKYQKLFINKVEIAILAGGCFWGMEELLRKLPGVIETEVGYISDYVNNKAESVKIKFNPKILKYIDLLNYFFRIHDPTTLNRQGNDIGTQYRSAIFYTSDKQKDEAKKSIKIAAKFWKKTITTETSKATDFVVAEKFHQDYLQKKPQGYTCHHYRK